MVFTGLGQSRQVWLVWCLVSGRVVGLRSCLADLVKRVWTDLDILVLTGLVWFHRSGLDWCGHLVKTGSAFLASAGLAWSGLVSAGLAGLAGLVSLVVCSLVLGLVSGLVWLIWSWLSRSGLVWPVCSGLGWPFW